MGISRVQKFKDYRNSLIKEETPTLETPKSEPKTQTQTISKETTSTLPMDEVIQSLQNDEDEAVFLKQVRRKKIIFIVSICAAALVLIGGIVIFGVLVWR